MNVLVFNCGSSSLKYKLIVMPEGRELCGGEAQRIGAQTAEKPRLVHRVDGREEIYENDMANHAAAFLAVCNLLASDPVMQPEVLAHRIVHGGSIFCEAALVTPDNLRDLEAIQHLAPIHNPPATSLVRSCCEQMPEIPQVVVFDTAFHRTLSPIAYSYAIPKDLREGRQYRKYGFHGTSHQYVGAEAARLLDKPLDELSAVSCHLGSGGASLCVIRKGRSVDTTMGYTPLQGLMMSTRCGDLDPGIVMSLLVRSMGDDEKVENLLNKRSGVLGMSGVSADIRDVLSRIKDGNDLHMSNPTNYNPLRATSQLYCWRIRKYLGSYLAVAGGADAVIFTDTIGEEVASVRWNVCSGMEAFGMRMDAAKNESPGRLPADVAVANSQVRILVVSTNEELAIAQQSAKLLAG